MNSSVKKSILLLSFTVFAFVFVLLAPNTSLAQTVYYTTECGEQFSIGSGSNVYCATCCGEYSCWSCCPCCTQYSCSGTWKEYKTDSTGCGPKTLVRECRSVCGPATACCSCGPCQAQCDPWETCEECGSWQKAERSCEVTKGGLTMPECNKCDKDCLDKPSNPRYYDDLLYPLNECTAETEYQMNSNNIYLPVKLDWDDVRGWKDQWSDGGCQQVKTCSSNENIKCIEGDAIGQCKINCRNNCYLEMAKTILDWWLRPYKIPEIYKKCLSDCENECQNQYKTSAEGCTKICPYPEKCYPSSKYVKSYVIKITGGMRDCTALGKIDELEEKIEKETDPKKIEEYKKEIERIKKEELEISTYEKVLDKSEFIPPCSCMFKSNRTYQWQVKACCGANGTNCGAWSGPWSFTTNPAPEPKLPYDPDWQGSGKAENLSQEQSERLQWCKMEDKTRYEETTIFGEKYYRPLSYNVLIYYLNQDLCHPQLSFGGQCIPDILSPDKARGEKLPPDEFADDYSVFFTKETPYAWKVAACRDTRGFECSDYSQFWKFGTGSWSLSVALVGPPNDNQTPIGLPALLKWTSRGANSFNYELIGVKSGMTTVANVAFDYPQLALNTVYSWRVQPCLDYEGKECEDTWFGPWSFKTTGQAPQLSYPAGDNVPIPINFDWEDVPGAKSYVFKIQGGGLDKEEPTEKSEFLLDYPDLKQETDYTWQVKTCAREGGNACGGYSASQSFRTFKLSTPAGLNPGDEGEIYTYQSLYNISWEPVAGARFYQYEVIYTGVGPEDPKIEECQGLIGEKIVLPPNNVVSRSLASLPLRCWGNYQWQVKACLDISCQESGDYSSLQTFSFVAKEAPPEARGWGLVPCGRATYDPTTPWDETEKCQIKHIFIMFFSILDFLLWKVIPLILVLLAIASGVIFYFSMKMETPSPVAKVKSLWKAAGIGLAIIFFAWTIVSFFLTLFGYQVGIFGPWWQIF